MSASIALRLVKHPVFRSAVVVPFWVLRFLYYAVRERSLRFLRFYPGYHGSTIPSGRVLSQDRDRLFGPGAAWHDGVDLHEQAQRSLLEEFSAYYAGFVPSENPAPGRLYHYGNAMFGFSDAFVLYSVFRKFTPRRVIEVGSGHSSALMLDIAQEHLPATQFTFIDPYSQTIQRVIGQRPQGNYRLLRTPIQEADPALVEELEAGDVLFIDTSHALKIGSDMSTIFFTLLPALRPGVLVHVHDITYPWEYTEEMVMAGRTYNEIYFLRAFLQFNDAFQVLYFNSQMEHQHRAFIQERMPGYFKSSGQRTGQSLWLRRVK